MLGRLVFHGAAIAFCAIGSLKISGDAVLKEMQIMQLKAREVAFLDLDPRSFEEFCAEMRAETGIGWTLQLGATSIRHEASQTPGA